MFYCAYFALAREDFALKRKTTPALPLERFGLILLVKALAMVTALVLETSYNGSTMALVLVPVLYVLYLVCT